MSRAKSNLNTLRPTAPARTHSSLPHGSSHDFIQQSIEKQQKSNFHSSSLKKAPVVNNPIMPEVVNQTALHPGGIQYVVVPRSAQSLLLPSLHAYIVAAVRWANFFYLGHSTSTPRSKRNSTRALTLTMIAWPL